MKAESGSTKARARCTGGGSEDAAATAGKMPALLGKSVTIFLRPADTYFD
jgi:hypothetical protein